ncbi:MAG: NADH-quinone oxidoreductase subunit N [Sulfurospirillum sp.]|nr:NADH-quinone oxidoreductase subunit N [Sulfurospirillum sp.]
MYPDFLYIAPLVFVGFGGILLMLLSPFKQITIRMAAFIALFFMLCATGLYFYNISELYSYYPYAQTFGSMIVADNYSAYFSTILLAGAIFTILIGVHYFEKNRGFTTEFFSLFLFSLFGMMLLVHATELITVLIALEIASLSLYVMIGFQKHLDKRMEASFRYLVLGSISGAFFLLGTAFIYANTQTTKISQIGIFIQNNPQSDVMLLIMGVCFIFITFLFKIAAFPLQNWAIDVYDGAPYPVTAFMAGTFKAAIFGFILRFVLVDLELIIDFWDNILYVVILLTLLYGSFLAIIQQSLKRMLAASSIVHTGYLLIAFISIDITGKSAASSIIFYLVAYFLSSMGAFGLLSYISSDDKVRITYEDFRGFAHIRPYMAAMMSVFMLSLAGIPSTIGFIGKFYIFVAAIESGYTLLAVFGILATFVSIYYYFRLIAIMYFYPSAKMQDVPTLHGMAPYFIGIISLIIIWGGIGNTLITYFPGVDFLMDMARLAYDSLQVK